MKMNKSGTFAKKILKKKKFKNKKYHKSGDHPPYTREYKQAET